jgi:hypothetical protein
MEIHVFSSNKKCDSWFSALDRARKYSVEFHPQGDIRAWTRKNGNGSFAYIDIQGMTEREVRTLLRYLSSAKSGSGSRTRPLLYGVIDPGGSIVDTAEIFHGGAIDYIGKAVAKGGIAPKRIERVARYAENVLELRETVLDQRTKQERRGRPPATVGGIALRAPTALLDGQKVPPPDTTGYRYSGSDWSSIEPETEYTFWIAYVNFNAPHEMAGRQSSQHTEHLVSLFQTAMMRYMEPAGGKIWMWRELEGLLLFPFDGRRNEPLLAIYRFMLNQNLVNAEELDQAVPISFHFAVDIGNTTYRQSGQTGTIISDSVNFIFHLGKKVVPERDLTVTGNVFHLLPERMLPLARAAGKFEGRHLYEIAVPSPA